MQSYITSELARLRGEDLRRYAEHRRRARELPRRRLPAVVAELGQRLVDRRSRPSALPAIPAIPALPVMPVIPRQAGPRDLVSPLLDVADARDVCRDR